MKNDLKTIRISRISECNFGDTIEYNNCIEQDMTNNQSNRLFNRFTTVPPNLTVNIDININDNNNINIGNNKVKIVKKVNGNKNISSNNKFRKK